MNGQIFIDSNKNNRKCARLNAFAYIQLYTYILLSVCTPCRLPACPPFLFFSKNSVCVCVRVCMHVLFKYTKITTNKRKSGRASYISFTHAILYMLDVWITYASNLSDKRVNDTCWYLHHLYYAAFSSEICALQFACGWCICMCVSFSLFLLISLWMYLTSLLSCVNFEQAQKHNMHTILKYKVNTK